MRGTSIYVEIYDDRVVIVNPGGLPQGITKANFGKESIRRNLTIADLFHRMGKVERIGSGIQKMRDLMKEAGLKEPVFESEVFFRAIFYRDPQYSLKGAGSLKSSPKRSLKSSPKRSLKSSPKRSLKSSPKTEDKIIQFIGEDKHVTTKNIAINLGISKRAVLKQIDKLKKEGRLKRIGPAKGGHWEIL
ncbi:MAG: winged helix-turn-helix transcriptional regulator [Candidatus Omnitrophica bacterium]|nr:winged helix-turn-helix transcriptional regulator [Candidatus Omnitrophota bacterium]